MRISRYLPVIPAFVLLLAIGCAEKTVPATRTAPNVETTTAETEEKSAVDPFAPRNPLENLSVVEPTPPPPTSAPTVDPFPVSPPAPAPTVDPFPVSPPVEAPPTTPAPAVDPFPVSPPVEAPPPTPAPAVDPFPVSPPVEAPPAPPIPEPAPTEEPMDSVEQDTKVEAPSEEASEPLFVQPMPSVPSMEDFSEPSPPPPPPEPPVMESPEKVTADSVEQVENQAVEHPPASFAEPAAEKTAEPVVKVASAEAPQEVSPDVSQDRPAYDPIAVNGEIFVDWPKPKLLLVFTGFMNGYVEPCGCAGLEQMKGGLSRRHSLFKELKEKRGWPVLAIDGGNLNKGFGRQEELKYDFVINESLRLMNYRAAGIGDRELLLTTDMLIVYAVDVPGSPKLYTSANVAVLAFDPSCTMPYRVLEESGMKVAVTSVLGPSACKEINNPDIVHEDAVRKLKEVLPKIAEEKCDRKVLVVNGTPEETNRILKSVTGVFDFVLVSDTPAEPPLKPNWVGNSMLIEVGEKGKFAVAIGLYDDPETPVRYQRVPLDSRFENSKDILALMRLYQNELKSTGLKGLGIKPIPERRAAAGGKYVGSKSCADCHEPSYDVWRKSRHATAWRSLAVTSNPPRTHDPECIACHVVGWSPTEFLPYENGFLGEKETPHLKDVGCESCHGPGENHNKAEAGSDETLKAALRKAMRLPLENNAAKKLCIECHDGDNSPHFDFDAYWPKVVHPESEE